MAYIKFLDCASIRDNGCGVLKKRICDKQDTCPFYKTKNQIKSEREYVAERLEKLNKKEYYEAIYNIKY